MKLKVLPDSYYSNLGRKAMKNEKSFCPMCAFVEERFFFHFEVTTIALYLHQYNKTIFLAKLISIKVENEMLKILTGLSDEPNMVWFQGQLISQLG